ncbi:MAG: pseudouridine synthase [Flavobacteriales bacterium]|nr:pseudouridine synthase [Flavobacteriales bacterium]MBK6752046.1 pseudouridine synthase [Flavobacteriales bacterium]MBK7270576.1 pseudouridine synthase [Flavobacteriales bacterium]MBK9075665.1 pseudouridine synthase [Flavobacteriales bacterium]MBK9537564.1 pseudouridine synthase [Flavobacteriales bacterium]
MSTRNNGPRKPRSGRSSDTGRRAPGPPKGRGGSVPPWRKKEGSEDRPAERRPASKGDREERPKSSRDSAGIPPHESRGRADRPTHGASERSGTDRRPPKGGGRSDRPTDRRDRPSEAGESRGARPKGGAPPREERPGGYRGRSPERKSVDRGPRTERPYNTDRGPRQDGGYSRNQRDERQVNRVRPDDPGARQPFRRGERSNRFALPNPANEGLVRLNRYLAQAGVGSRRAADVLISSGAVTVNGKVVTELGTRIKPEDIVHFGGQKLSMEQKRYVLLNKPKDFITTTDDPKERRTVMNLIAAAGSERLYPVGRLDRNTTGVLLLTNDGDLAKKLTHPSYGAEKLYHATLDKNVTAEDLERLVHGVQLDDGPARADEVSYAGETKREVGLKLHMGRNRVVRRMFEALGYEVVKLDRVMFAGLTKKDITRGHWRHLSEAEITLLKRVKPVVRSNKEERGGRRTRLSQGED